MEIQRKILHRIPFLIVLMLLFFSLVTPELSADLAPISFNDDSSVVGNNEMKIGVILDLGSRIGRTVHSCITVAISDFYASNIHYKTRLVLHTRDSRGDPAHATSAALDLLANVNVVAIIAPVTFSETKSLAALGNNSKVPIFSFHSILASYGKHPFLVQIKQDETFQFRGIASILSWYEWRTVVVIYEDSENGRDFLPVLVRSLQEKKIRITYRTAISPFSSDDQILDELHKLSIVQQTIFVVHMSPVLTSRLFLTAKGLGMMKEGYAWIVSDKTMNHFQSLDSEVVESMQGVLGLKAYIPSSTKLREFSLRWKNELYGKNPLMMELSNIELDVLGVWAHDTMWALAESIERVGSESLMKAAGNQSTRGLSSLHNYDLYSGTRLVEEIERTRFTGLSGEFQILDGRLRSEAFAIVNVIGKGERRVGFWTPKDGIVKKMQPLLAKGRSLTTTTTTTQRGLDNKVIWPGDSTTAPKGRLMLTDGRKLRLAVLNNAGFKEFISVEHNHQANTTSITGFCVDVFQAAIGSLDYQVPYEFIPYVDENGNNVGSYSDLAYQVYLQNYDGIVGDITITGNRSLYVDFTVSYTDLGIGTITKRESNDIWLFSKPLRPDLWVTSAAFFVLMGLVVWAIEHPTNVEFQGSVVHQIGTILWFGFSTLVYAHREKLTSNLSRFVVLVWLFVVLILTASYIATLSSMLTIQQIRLRTAGEYIGTHRNSFLGGVVASNFNFTYHYGLQQYTSPEEYDDALSRGKKKGGVDVIIDEIPYIKVFLAKYGATYAMVASHSTTNGFGFAFQKDHYSHLVSDLSRAIIKLREDGKLEMMEKTWIKKSRSLMPDDDAQAPNILNIRSFGGLFLITFLSCFLALLVHYMSVLRNYLLYFPTILMKLLEGEIFALMVRHLFPRQMEIQ